MTTETGTDRITNLEFSRKDSEFHNACTLAGISPTTRQASKFRNKKGAAYSALMKEKAEIHHQVQLHLVTA